LIRRRGGSNVAVETQVTDLLRISRWCSAVSQLEACSRSTSHHLDLTDLPGHGKSRWLMLC